jgi:hypothetical protein
MRLVRDKLFMDPLTAALNVLAAAEALAAQLVAKASPETVDAVIKDHLARRQRIEAWIGKRFGFLRDDDGDKRA